MAAATRIDPARAAVENQREHALLLPSLHLRVLFVCAGKGHVSFNSGTVARCRNVLGASGTVRSQVKSPLAFEVGRRISTRLVDAGQRVRRGDVLMRLHPDDLDQAVAEAEQSAATSTLATAESDLRRDERLLEQNFVSESALERAVILFFLILSLLAGLYAFTSLGRAEDPSFPVRVMQVSALWPGASAEQMQRQVVDRLEKRIQEVENLYRLESTVRTLQIEFEDYTPQEQVPDLFYQVRKRMLDEAASARSSTTNRDLLTPQGKSCASRGSVPPRIAEPHDGGTPQLISGSLRSLSA